MTLTELQYIVALADTQHFGLAARVCNVSQPTLSIAVKKLEEELSLSLFERARGSVKMTPLGQQIVAKARQIFQAVSDIEGIAHNAQDPLFGPLAIGTLPTVGPYLLPQCIPLLRTMARGLTLHVEEADSQTLSKKLRNGELDAAILSLPFSATDILVQPVLAEALVALVPADHPLANKNDLAPEDIDAGQTLLLSEGNCLREQVLAAFPHLKTTPHTQGNACPPNTYPPNNAHITGSSIEALRNMVASGLGITILPASAAASPVYTRHQVCVKTFGEFKPTRTIALAWRASFPRHQTIDVLRRAVQASSAAYWHYGRENNQLLAETLVDNNYW